MSGMGPLGEIISGRAGPRYKLPETRPIEVQREAAIIIERSKTLPQVPPDDPEALEDMRRSMAEPILPGRGYEPGGTYT